MLLQLQRAVAAMLPAGWFELHRLGDVDPALGRDHFMIERISGPPVGSFQLWRQDGSVHVRILPEADFPAGTIPWRERHCHASDAVRAIADVIAARLRDWSLPVPPPVPDHHDVVVMALRPDLLRAFVSRSSLDVMGYNPAELLGGHPRAVIHPEDWPRVMPLLALCRRITEPVRDTHRVRHKDGRLLWMEGCYTGRADGGYTILLHDIARTSPPNPLPATPAAS